MEAAMTGHLVFSTLHTNSSAETITRTYNLGAKSYQLCGTFNLIMAQRLSRKLCPTCQTEISIADSDHYHYAKESLAQMDAKKLETELKLRNITQDEWGKFSDGNITIGTGKLTNGDSCTTCNGTGYKWRVGLFECMEYDDVLKDMLLHDKTAFEVEKVLLENGMISLERDGIFKTIKGLTTLEEVYRLSKHR